MSERESCSGAWQYFRGRGVNGPGTILVWGQLICALLGCGPSGPTLYPVSGEVKVDGAPLEVGSVALHPDAAKGNSTLELPVGEIQGGRYQITTGDRPGAPPGAYKVVVVANNLSGNAAPPPPTGGTAELPKSLIHQKYSDPRLTPLTVEVVEHASPGAYDLNLTR